MYRFRSWPTPQESGIDDPDLIYEWHERVAICVVDGELDEQTARAVAWGDLIEKTLRTHGDTHFFNASETQMKGETGVKEAKEAIQC